MVELSIKLKKGRAKSFKKHLEKTHPSVRGKVEIEEKRHRGKSSKPLSNRLQANTLTKNSPNFPKIAAEYIHVLRS